MARTTKTKPEQAPPAAPAAEKEAEVKTDVAEQPTAAPEPTPTPAPAEAEPTPAPEREAAPEAEPEDPLDGVRMGLEQFLIHIGHPMRGAYFTVGVLQRAVGIYPRPLRDWKAAYKTHIEAK